MQTETTHAADPRMRFTFSITAALPSDQAESAITISAHWHGPGLPVWEFRLLCQRFSDSVPGDCGTRLDIPDDAFRAFKDFPLLFDTLARRGPCHLDAALDMLTSDLQMQQVAADMHGAA